MKNTSRNSVVKRTKTEVFDTKSLKDLEIVERLKAGDAKAYDYIHKRFYDYIFYHCFLSVKNKQTAEDLTMEILTKVYLNIDKYTVQYTFNTWVWSLARNHVIDFIRKSKNEPVNCNVNTVISSTDKQDYDDISYSGISGDKLTSNYNDPEQSMQIKRSDKLRQEFVSNLLGKVTEKERAILVHYYFDEMSYDEIASKLNIGLSSMKVTLMRAKEKLKNKIGSYDKISHLFAM